MVEKTMETKTIRGILNASIQGKALITKTEWLEKNELKRWTSNKSLISRLETDFFNPKNHLVGKSPEYIIGYFLNKVMELQKELEGKKDD